MLDIQAYCDESESPEHLVLTCAVAKAVTWRTFAEAWSSLLARERLTEFKAHDCVHGAEEFKGRDNDNRMNLYREFLETITACRIHSAAVVVEKSSFPLIASALGPTFLKPWPFALTQLLPLVTQRVPPQERIDFTFDEQHEYASAALQGFTSYKENRNPFVPNLSAQLGRITFADSKLHPPLQAADLLGFEVRLRFRDERPPRKSWQAIAGQLDSIVISYVGKSQAERFSAMASALAERGKTVRELSKAEMEEVQSSLPPRSRRKDNPLGSYATDLGELPLPDWERPSS